ncbi:MAG: ABC transporter permease, partial [Erysipelotrichaceae bacterium]
FYIDLLVVDNPYVIQDANNPDLERGYSFGTTPTGAPALLCSGCNYKYQVYVDSNFPFIHQNVISLDFGLSFPTYQGIETIDVINTGQGNLVYTEQTFPTGVVQDSPIIQTSCTYKTTLDHLDQNKFDDNYANCTLSYSSPSMINTSYIFGISSIILSYLIAIPFAIAMARKKGQWLDKIGIAYINFLIAVPSLAFIFIVKKVGFTFGFPDKFPQYGFGDYRSYVLPILILALLSTASTMMWLRRFMIDQSNADYVKFAKAKGLSQKEIFNNHILKNAIIPIVNGIPAAIILAISGSVITETVFAIPGMGKMLPDSISAVNNNMVITLTFIFTALAIISVFLGDLLMIKVDPRIQLAEKGGKK